jgi:hypothetical protein
MRNILTLCALLLIFGSCKKDKKEDTSPENVTLLVTPVANTTGPVIQQMIGPGGGTITSADGRVSLTFPAGALETNQTISIQPIENKLPSGASNSAYRFLPHGLQFKVPVQLTFQYNEQEIANSAPEFLSLATQQDGKWKIPPGSVTVNKTAKTVTARLQHFSDYAWFESCFIQVGDKIDQGEYSIDPGSKVKIAVVIGVNGNSNELIVPLVIPASNVLSWKINGEAVASNQYGTLANIDPPNQAIKEFQAPVNVVSNGSLVAISVEIKNPTGGPGQFMLVANLLLQFENSFRINGTDYRAGGVSAFKVGNTLQVSLSTAQGAVASFTIENFTGPGSYQFNTPRNSSEPGYTGYFTTINASMPNNGGHFSNRKPDPGNPGKYFYSSGTVVVHQGRAPGDILKATFNGLLYNDNAPGNATISGSVSTRAN